MLIEKNTGRKILQRIQESGVTAEVFAGSNGMSKSHLSHILNGRTRISPRKFNRLFEQFGFNVPVVEPEPIDLWLDRQAQQVADYQPDDGVEFSESTAE